MIIQSIKESGTKKCKSMEKEFKYEKMEGITKDDFKMIYQMVEGD